MFKRILRDLDISINNLILICCNNLNNIHLAWNPTFHPQTKHMFVFSLGSGAISWSSKKKSIVALSSTTVEYRSTVVAALKSYGLRGF